MQIALVANCPGESGPNVTCRLADPTNQYAWYAATFACSDYPAACAFRHQNEEEHVKLLIILMGQNDGEKSGGV